MNYERKFKVAISQFPLMDAGIDVSNPLHCLGLDQTCLKDRELILYIHIPFCDHICDFCIYNRMLTRNHKKLMQQYTQALIKEIRMYSQSAYIKGKKIRAIYFGGGTPSALDSDQLCNIISACKEAFSIENDVEITVESNPLNAGYEKLCQLKAMGVNRISAGIQSFLDKSRKDLGVALSQAEVLRWIEMANTCKFDVLAIDLMYGCPGQTIKDWEEDLKIATQLPVQHISIYELYVILNTKLSRRIQAGSFTECTDEQRFRMFGIAAEYLSKKGFQRQIVPEFHRENHSSTYWDLAFDAWTDSIAVGVSSYGFINGRSYQNVSNINEYIQSIHNERLPIHLVSKQANAREMAERDAVFSLRHGRIDKQAFYFRNRLSVYELFDEIIKKQVVSGILLEDQQYLTLSLLGLYLQEDVAVEYMRSIFENRSLSYKKLAIGMHQIF